MNKLTEDKTITYVSSEDLFSDGSLMTGTALSTKYIKFDQNSLLANDIENFEVNNNGELIVRKKGTYHINAVISLHYDVANGARRDAFEGEIQLNGNSLPFPLKAHYGFPNAGTDFVFDNSFAITGFVELNENDRLRLKLYRYYADSPGSAVISPNGQQTNLTLRYMGEL